MFKHRSLSRCWVSWGIFRAESCLSSPGILVSRFLVKPSEGLQPVVSFRHEIHGIGADAVLMWLNMESLVILGLLFW